MKYKYLLLGKDIGLQNDKLEELKKQAEKKFGSFEIKKFYANDKKDVSLFISTLLENSLFSEKEFLILYEADSLPAQSAKSITAHLKEEEDEDKFVVLCSTENKLSSSELERAFDKNERFIFYEMFEREKIPFLMTEARKRGVAISHDAASLILSLREHNTLELRNALDEIVTFINASSLPPRIESDVILSFLSHARGESGFSIVAYISKMNKEAALQALESIINESSFNASSLFAALTFSLKRIECALKNKEEGKYGDAIYTIKPNGQDEVVIRSPQEKDTINSFMRNYKRADVTRMLKSVIDTELLLRKTDAIMHPVILSRMIALF